MTRTQALTAALALGLAAGAAAASAPPSERAPTDGQIAEAYPPAALGARVSGLVKMACKVRDDGTLADCRVLRECPVGWGFGDSSLKIARFFRLRPKTIDGKPTAGSTVLVPIEWKGPDGGVPASC